jgi:hypothetical protein
VAIMAQQRIQRLKLAMSIYDNTLTNDPSPKWSHSGVPNIVSSWLLIARIISKPRTYFARTRDGESANL